MIKRGLITGVILLATAFGFNWLSAILFPSLSAEYQNIAIFRLWNDPIMMLYFFYPFILGFVLSYLWKVLKTKDPVKFAWFYFLVAGIPGMFISYTTFQVSLLMIVSWSAVGFLQALIAGFVFTKIK